MPLSLSRPARLASLPLLLLVAPLSISACGSSTPPSPAAQLDAAATKTAAITSVHLVGTISESASGGGASGSTSESERTSGEADLSEDRFRLSVTSPSAPTQTVVESGNRVWLTVATPGFAKALPTGKSWVGTSFSAARTAGALIQPPSQTLGLTGYLRGARNIRRTAGGGYAFTIDRAAALAAAPASQRAGLRSALTVPTGPGVTTSISGTAQLASGGQVRSMALTVRAHKAATKTTAAARLGLTISVDLSDVDAATTITPPTAAQTDQVDAAGLKRILRTSGLQPSG